MIRNELVCVLSEALIVIESGPERDEEGRMSGTFNAAKIALEREIPLFVVDPSYFKKLPLGNEKLIKGIQINRKIKCGIKLSPENAIETLREHLGENIIKKAEPTATGEQLKLEF